MSRKREIFLQALDQPVKARSAFVERTTAVRVEMVFQANSPARAVGARVTFEPGARTAWHTHPLGQTLIVTDGVGWVQREGGPVEEVSSVATVRAVLFSVAMIAANATAQGKEEGTDRPGTGTL